MDRSKIFCAFCLLVFNIVSTSYQPLKPRWEEHTANRKMAMGVRTSARPKVSLVNVPLTGRIIEVGQDVRVHSPLFLDFDVQLQKYTTVDQRLDLGAGGGPDIPDERTPFA